MDNGGIGTLVGGSLSAGLGLLVGASAPVIGGLAILGSYIGHNVGDSHHYSPKYS